MKNSKKLVLLFWPPLIFSIFILMTDPYRLPLPLLLIPFLLIGISCYCFIKEFLRMAPISVRKRKFIAVVLTIIILLGVLLQSIRQLSIKDFLILLALLIGVAFYMRRMDV